MDAVSVPRFARGFYFRHDAVRAQWIVLGPERAFVPDEVAVEVLRRVDGQATLGAIIDDLATNFAAPREEISADVLALMNELAGKGVVRS
jgi:pyrroloquinoline quinone biosynthesis protein D